MPPPTHLTDVLMMPLTYHPPTNHRTMYGKLQKENKMDRRMDSG